MRRLIWIALALAALWGGWWVVGSRGVDRAMTAWFEARRAEGWVAEYSGLAVRGFPNRFDTTIENIELADPDTGFAWSAPFFQIFALSYRPHHVIAVWPHDQTLASPWERIAVGSDDMRASAVFVPGVALALDHSSMVFEGLRLSSSLGWRSEVDKGLFATRRTAAAPDSDHRYDIAVEATGWTPPATLKDRLDPAGVLPGRVEGVTLDMTMGFDRAWDRTAIEDSRPQPRSLDLKTFAATWGRLDLRAAGSLVIDPSGIPEGQITLRAENWREMIRLAVAGGVLPDGLARTVETALGLVAALGPNPDVLDAPIGFSGGVMSFGPIPIGPAPRLILR